jgi:hypothetical protein
MEIQGGGGQKDRQRTGGRRCRVIAPEACVRNAHRADSPNATTAAYGGRRGVDMGDDGGFAMDFLRRERCFADQVSGVVPNRISKVTGS